MADTKISALTGISGGTLSDGDKFAVADASDLTASYSATAANIKTYVENGPNWAAGSATAGSWPQVASGTVQTTPDAGTFPEYDGNCFYGTADAGNRGVIRVEHFIRCDSAETLTSTTSAQAIFDSPTNGQITLETGTYLFELLVLFTGMSATTGNGQILFGGTGTFGTWLWAHYAIDNNSGTALLDLDNAFNVTNATASLAAATGTGTTLRVDARGTFECTSAGTLIPQIALTTAAAATVAAGSYFLLRRIGSTSVVSVGQWD